MWKRIGIQNNDQRIYKRYFNILLLTVLYSNCNIESDPILQSSHSYLVPDYSKTAISVDNDSLTFPLDVSTYNNIKSFNVFEEGGENLISFYDDRSKSINIYKINSQEIIKRIRITDILKGRRLYKTTVYIESLDSIFISNYEKIYIAADRKGLYDSIKCKASPDFAWAYFQNNLPVIIKGQSVFTAVRPYMQESELSSIQKWKVIYEFNFAESNARLHYTLPEVLRKNYYGRRFLEHSFCFNEEGNFVFSFAGDSLIYVSDLINTNISYIGTSQFQTGKIEPVKKKELLEDNGYKNYLQRNSYGAIYYDITNKRYLRVASRGLSLYESNKKQNRKNSSLIIFDEHFNIIGESIIPDGVLLNSIFILKGGEIYARYRGHDEYALHFIRLKYSSTNKPN